MKLRSPNIKLPKWALNAIMGVWLLIASPIILMFVSFFGAVWLKRKAVGPTKDWRFWFAWYPCKVYIESEFWPDTEWRWLERVERRSFGIMHDTEVRSHGSAYEPRELWALRPSSSTPPSPAHDIQ